MDTLSGNTRVTNVLIRDEAPLAADGMGLLVVVLVFEAARLPVVGYPMSLPNPRRR